MPDVDTQGSNHADQWYFSDIDWNDDISFPIDDHWSNIHRFLGN